MEARNAKKAAANSLRLAATLAAANAAMAAAAPKVWIRGIVHSGGWGLNQDVYFVWECSFDAVR